MWWKRWLLIVVVVVWAGLGCAGARAADEEERATPIERAQKLEEGGQEDAAFRAYLQIPGAEQVALRLAQGQEAHFLALVAEPTLLAPVACRERVWADLLSAAGQPDEALVHVRRVATALLAERGPTAYAVEFTGPPAIGFFPYPHAPYTPFGVGPGSQRDNWLIRRLVAGGADHAVVAAEYARVWELHRQAAKPHVVASDDGGRPGLRLVTPTGFNRLGLQFAIDYAAFCHTSGQPARALPLLREVLLAMDLDRNPNDRPGTPVSDPAAVAGLPQLPGALSAGSLHERANGELALGLSRAEFVRLVYGEYQAQGQEAAMVALLEQEIAAGHNPLRRVLAQVRTLQQRPADALALEAAYLVAGKFDPLSAAMRRGLGAEAAGQLAAAVAAYEEALKLPYQTPDLPDADEAERATPHFYLFVFTRPYDGGDSAFGGATPPTKDPQALARQEASQRLAAQRRFRRDVETRLQRLYTAMGQPAPVRASKERQLQALLQAVATREHPPTNYDLEQLKPRFAALDQQAQFAVWARAQVGKAATDDERLRMLATLGDEEELLALAVKVPAQLPRWEQHFRDRGGDLWARFQRAQASTAPSAVNVAPTVSAVPTPTPPAAPAPAAPTDAARLQLLEAWLNGAPPEDDTSGDESAILTTRWQHTYELLRRYERAGRLDDLRALARRAALGEAPCGAWWAATWWNGMGSLRSVAYPEYLNATLALALHYATPADLAAWQAKWDALPDCPARRQLARRLATAPAAAPGPSFPWANLPPGVQALTGIEQVTCLAHDEQYLYAGHTWGLAVYDLAGQPVTRVALGAEARCLACVGGQVWIGTASGLLRLTPGTWQLGGMHFPPGVEDNPRGGDAVTALAGAGDTLWIATGAGVWRLAIATLDLRDYSLRRMGLDWRDFYGVTRLLVDDRYLWAQCADEKGAWRLDQTTDEWQPVRWENKPVDVLGPVGGQWYGTAHPLGRSGDTQPCRIDRDTLAITLLPVVSASSASRNQVKGGLWSYYGTWQGAPVLGTGGPAFVVDGARSHLRLLPGAGTPAAPLLQSVLPPFLYRSERVTSGDPIAGYRVTSEPQQVGTQSLSFYRWSLCPLADGRAWLGAHGEVDSEEVGPWGWATDRADDGGLWLVADAQHVLPNPARACCDTLVSDSVYAVVPGPDGQEAWLCTDHGVVQVDAAGRVRARYGLADGLCANRVVAGAALGGRLYFATAWADVGGGLAEFDPATRLFTARFHDDGLAADKLQRVTAQGAVLELEYAPQKLRDGSGASWCQSAPGTLDPRTGSVAAAGAVATFEQDQVDAHTHAVPVAQRPALPFLGGTVLSQVTVGGRQWLAGHSGLVIAPAGALPPLVIPPLPVHFKPDPAEAQLADAAAVEISVSHAAQLADWLRDPNPYVRAKAVQSLSYHLPVDAEYAPLVAPLVQDPCRELRRQAVHLLKEMRTPLVLPPLRLALHDTDAQIRVEAALGLAANGEVPPVALLEQTVGPKLHAPENSERRFYIERRNVALLLAPVADVAVVRFFFDHPLFTEDYDPPPTRWFYPPLGKAVAAHPELDAVLLTAHAHSDDLGQLDFTRQVYQAAGPAVLPRLQAALRSPDQVVRSNAARACGALGDVAAVPALVAALDLDSRLARASIVWALGQLRARAAVPALIALYTQQVADDQQHGGTDLRYSDNCAADTAPFAVVRSVAAVQDELVALRASVPAVPAVPGDPPGVEERLTAAQILAALAAIGGPEVQALCRRLAGSPEAATRAQVADYLACPAPAARDANHQVLLALAEDEDYVVQCAAALNLLYYDDPAGLRFWARHPADGATLDPPPGATEALAPRLLPLLRQLTHHQSPDLALRALAISVVRQDSASVDACNKILGPPRREREQEQLLGWLRDEPELAIMAPLRPQLQRIYDERRAAWAAAGAILTRLPPAPPAAPARGATP